MSDFRPGDLVQLPVRERPFADEADWWWTVVSVSDLGLNVKYGNVRRMGVAPEVVRDSESRAGKSAGPAGC